MRLLPTLALLLGAALPTALAIDPNVGASAFIDPATVTITAVDGAVPDGTVNNNTTLPVNDTVPANFTQLVRAADSIEYAFVVPIAISKGASPDSAVSVAVYLQEYDGDEEYDPSQQEYLVYQDYIDFDGQNSSSTTARFNLTVSSTNNTVFNLRAEVITDSPLYSTTAGYLVASHNATAGTWVSVLPFTYQAQVNEAIIAVDDALNAQADPGEDTTSETVIDDEDPELPPIDPSSTNTTLPGGGNSTLPGGGNTTLPGGGNTTLPGGGNTTLPGDGNSTLPGGGGHDKGPVTTPCETEKHKHHKPTPWMGMPEQPDDKPWVHHPHSKPKDSWDTKPCTTTPSPIPSPPCETDKDKDKAKWQYARQAKSKSTMRIKLTYGTSAAGAIPIRQLPVYAYGTPSNGGKKVKATGKTNNRGEVNLRWNLPAGVSITVSSVYVRIDGEAHRVATTTDGAKTFSTRRMQSNKVNWQVSPGETTDFQTYRFKAAVNIEYFNVHERIRVAHYFAKTQIANFKKEKVAVWYPGDPSFGDTSYFSNQNPPYISVANGKSKFSSTLGHEYGHWFHYLIRFKKALNWGGAHNFCDTSPESETLALGEGYATAFGILAMRNTPYKIGSGTAYCFSASDDPAPNCLEIDAYDCSAISVADRSLSTDEGRVAAALLDLVDSTTDDNGLDPARGVTGKTDNSKLPTVTVLGEPMIKNPATMAEYWTNFKAAGKLLGIPNQSEVDKAWEVLEYQYVKGFSK